jgi:molecular chaperone GrpE
MSHDEALVNSPGSAAATDDPTAGTSPALAEERDRLREQLLRTAAEFDNFRKRTERERRDLAEAAAADLIRDLLPVLDDFQRALAAPGWHDQDGARRGVELIHRQLLEVLRKRGVEPFETVGHRFDPQWHEAVATEPAGTRPDGEITAEVRRGYRLGQRLLRPAQVKVARA